MLCGVPSMSPKVKWKWRRHTLWFGTVTGRLWKHIKNTAVVFTESYTHRDSCLCVFSTCAGVVKKVKCQSWGHSLIHIWQRQLCNSWAFNLGQSTEIDYDKQLAPVCARRTNSFILNTLQLLERPKRGNKYNTKWWGNTESDCEVCDLEKPIASVLLNIEADRHMSCWHCKQG